MRLLTDPSQSPPELCAQPVPPGASTIRPNDVERERSVLLVPLERTFTISGLDASLRSAMEVVLRTCSDLSELEGEPGRFGIVIAGPVAHRVRHSKGVRFVAPRGPLVVTVLGAAPEAKATLFEPYRHAYDAVQRIGDPDTMIDCRIAEPSAPAAGEPRVMVWKFECRMRVTEHPKTHIGVSGQVAISVGPGAVHYGDQAAPATWLTIDVRRPRPGQAGLERLRYVLFRGSQLRRLIQAHIVPWILASEKGRPFLPSSWPQYGPPRSRYAVALQRSALQELLANALATPLGPDGAMSILDALASMGANVSTITGQVPEGTRRLLHGGEIATLFGVEGRVVLIWAIGHDTPGLRQRAREAHARYSEGRGLDAPMPRVEVLRGVADQVAGHLPSRPALEGIVERLRRAEDARRSSPRALEVWRHGEMAAAVLTVSVLSLRVIVAFDRGSDEKVLAAATKVMSRYEPVLRLVDDAVARQS